MENKVFYVSGIVLGTLYSGEMGAYTASRYKTATYEEAITEGLRKLKDGSLDSGMGFKELKGALLIINEQTTVEVNNEKYLNEKIEEEFIGELSGYESDFLLDTAFLFESINAQ